MSIVNEGERERERKKGKALERERVGNGEKGSWVDKQVDYFVKIYDLSEKKVGRWVDVFLWWVEDKRSEKRWWDEVMWGSGGGGGDMWYLVWNGESHRRMHV